MSPDATMDFEARFRAAFPGITTVTQVTVKLEEMAKTVVKLKAAMELMSTWGAKQVIQRRIEDLTDRMKILQESLKPEGLFDPKVQQDITAGIRAQGAAQKEALEYMEQSVQASERLRKSVVKVRTAHPPTPGFGAARELQPFGIDIPSTAMMAVEAVSIAMEKIVHTAGVMKTALASGWKAGIGPLNRFKKSLDDFRKKFDQLSKRVRRFARSIRAWGRNFLWLGRDITIFSAMAVGAAVKATTAWAKFEEQVRVTSRVLERRAVGGPDVEPAFKAEDLIIQEGIMGDIMEAADNMAISVSAATMSFGHLIRAGYGVGTALEIAEQAMILNRGSMISLADATDMMIIVQRHWKDGMYSAANVADIFTIADETAVKSLGELASGFGFAAGTAARLGMSLEQTTAAMVVLTNAGFSSSVAGRELRSVMNNLMQNAEDYGIRIKDATGEMLSFENILQSVEDRMDYFGTELEKTQFLQEVFGETNVSLVQTLMKNRDEMKKLTEEYENSGGAADTAAEKMKQTLEFQLDRIRSGIEKLTLAIGKGFSEALLGTDDFLVSFANTLNTALPIVEQLAFHFGVGFVRSVMKFVSIAQTAAVRAYELGEALGLINRSVSAAGEEVSKQTSAVELIGENLGMAAGFALIIGPAMMAVGVALELLAPIMFTLSVIVTALGFALSALSAIVGVLTAVFGALAGAVGAVGLAPVILIIVLVVAAILILIGVVQALIEHADALAVPLSYLEYIFMGLRELIIGVIAVLWPLIVFFITLGQIIGKIIVIVILIAERIGILGLVIGIIAGALYGLGKVLQYVGGILQWFADLLTPVLDILDAIIAALYGESPGIIPGLEASTDALKDFNEEAGRTEGIDMPGVMAGTAAGMYDFAAPNLETYTEVAGEGVVELGPDTRAFFQRLMGVEPETDWSFAPEVPAGTPTIVAPKAGGAKAKRRFGGISPK